MLDNQRSIDLLSSTFKCFLYVWKTHRARYRTADIERVRSDDSSQPSAEAKSRGTSAKVIASYESMAVAAVKKVGKGQVYYVGTNLGASIEEGSEEGIALVRAIVDQVVQPTTSSDKVRPRLIESANGALLIVFNDQITDQSAKLQAPSRFKEAVDIYENRSQTIHDGVVEIQAPYQGVTIFRLL